MSAISLWSGCCLETLRKRYVSRALLLQALRQNRLPLFPWDMTHMSNETVLQMFSLNRTTACREQRGIRRSQDAGTSDPTVKYVDTLTWDQQICGD